LTLKDKTTLEKFKQYVIDKTGDSDIKIISGNANELRDRLRTRSGLLEDKK
jgi:hypothetical protein